MNQTFAFVHRISLIRAKPPKSAFLDESNRFDTMANARYLVNRDPSHEIIARFAQNAAGVTDVPGVSYGQERVRPGS
jgi:hypothetical protein